LNYHYSVFRHVVYHVDSVSEDCILYKKDHWTSQINLQLLISQFPYKIYDGVVVLKSVNSTHLFFDQHYPQFKFINLFVTKFRL